MGLFQRVGDIIAANLNEMMERFEDPEMMLRQAVREMESSIADAKQEVARVMASEKLTKKNLDENERQAREWQERAEKAVAAGDDALARKALTRKQEYAKVAAALRDQWTATADASRTLRRQLEAMQVKLGEARRKLGTLAARKKAADIRARLERTLSETEVSQNAFEKFDRLRQKVERMEAEAEALHELEGGAVRQPVTEPEPQAEHQGVDEELEALKRKLHG